MCGHQIYVTGAWSKEEWTVPQKLVMFVSGSLMTVMGGLIVTFPIVAPVGSLLGIACGALFRSTALKNGFKVPVAVLKNG